MNKVKVIYDVDLDGSWGIKHTYVIDEWWIYRSYSLNIHAHYFDLKG